MDSPRVLLDFGEGPSSDACVHCYNNLRTESEGYDLCDDVQTYELEARIDRHA